MTGVEFLQKIYDGEFALVMILEVILMLLAFWFGNRGGK